MKIINPLYDYAFKYLMQNNRMAKKVISTLLECEVIELTIEQQEIVTVHESKGLKLYRLDFSAIIINEEGEKQKILIELQKSKLPTNLLRFRTYLGESYIKREIYQDEFGKEQERAYPIVSIYILGYNVEDIPYLAVSIDNKIINTVTQKEVNINSDFIKYLTHKTRVIQIRRLTEKRQSRLEQFLTIFNQAWVTADNYILDLQEIPEAFLDVINHLRIPVNDLSFRQKLKGEKEIDDIFKNQEAAIARAEEALRISQKRIEELQQLNKEKVAEIEEQTAKAEEQAIKAKEKVANAEEQATKAKEQVAEAEKSQKLMQLQFAKHLLAMNTPISKIIELTDLSEEDIKAIQ